MNKTLRFVVALSFSALATPVLSASLASASTSVAHCVVSLSPSATETLFAIGAGPQVGAVDQDSTYPAAAATLAAKHKINPLSPSVESLIGICTPSSAHPSKKPDLVVISYNENSIQQKLTALGVKVLVQAAPTTLAQAYAQITQLGQLTGHVAAASAIDASIAKTIKNDTAQIKAISPMTPLNVFYEIGNNPYYSLTSTTFVGSLLKALGVDNIADPESTSADAGYPSLTAEYILSSNPDLIFTADAASASDVAVRTGFSAVKAVVNKQVYALDPNLASEWGPRLGVLMNALTAGVKSAISASAK